MQERMAALEKEMPEVTKALKLLHDEVTKEGALDTKTKELILVAVAVALKCEYCLWNHVPMAVKLGASRQEILEATGAAILMAGGPGAAYGSVVVLKILDELKI
ncbi:MAG: Carboxymuconolactone decarboxylase family protein [Methanosaeta sp. PtaU1.Bin016]|nr:MAG: Carboxymuconolactone decarboxylase family protein [Methanosaeta sp. PtaU1.Bin016]